MRPVRSKSKDSFTEEMELAILLQNKERSVSEFRASAEGLAE